MEPIRVIELFSGIGSQAQALKNLGIPHKVVAISEIDKYAIAGYEAIHGPVNNLGDITKIKHLPDCDLITYSFPCQDLSIAGMKKGMAEGTGTRSALLWEVGRLLKDMREREALPEVLLMENVDAILNKENKPNFMRWIITLNDLGYVSSYKVLNAKDYGIPQNRDRCFMVSTLTKGTFRFPKKRELKTCLKDYLDKEVDEDYYLSQEKIAKYKAHAIKMEAQGMGLAWRPLSLSDDGTVAHSILTKQDRSTTNFLIVAGTLEQGGDLEMNNRIHSPKGIAPCIRVKQQVKIVEGGTE